MTDQWKKRLSIGAGVLATLTLAACGNGEDATGGSVENGEEASLETITIMAPTFETTAPPADNPWELAVEEFTDQDIDIDWVPNSNYEDRFNVTLASDNIPHVLVVQGKDPGFLNSAEAGAFWELTDYLDEYENLSRFDEEVLLNSSVNGVVYGLPRERDLMRSTAIIRQDWLDNLGLEAPTSVEELYDVLYAFAHEDPNQSGQDDTTGMIVPSWHGPFDTLSIWMGAPNQWGFDGETIYPAFETEEYREALDLIRQMVDEGLINQDFTTMSPDDWDSAMFNGDGGVIIDVHSRAMRINNLFNEDAGTENEKYVEITGTLTYEGNEFGQPTDGYSGFLAIPRTNVQTEEELHYVLSFLDELASVEGANLLGWGVEGETYELNDEGYVVELDAMEEWTPWKPDQLAMIGQDMHQLEPAGELTEIRMELEEANAENAVHSAAAPLVSDVYARQGTQLDEIIEDARVQYVAGQIDEDGWDAAVERWYSSGGQQVIDELTELYHELLDVQE